MTHILWTAAFFRILAVWLACGVLIEVPVVLSGVLEAQHAGSDLALRTVIVPSLFGWAVAAIIVAALWLRAPYLSELVWRDRPAPEVVSRLDGAAVQRAIFIGFGVYLVAYGVPDLTEFVGRYASMPEGFALEGVAANRARWHAAGIVVQMVGGVALIRWSGQIASSLANRNLDDGDGVDQSGGAGADS